ncbi:flavin-containing monooxygenase [Microbacterium sp. CH12i]|uniref:flavin-containing monooxygenase n=1 Tax=Microbacterium sp. CH12i TaxID=1479651 RepID=UPI000AA6CA1E|nr:NAD(P)/FAD-dependent oxidoreductase [Microbacterium sp. CH12i]
MMNEDLMLDEKLFGTVDFDPEALRARYQEERDLRVRPEGKAQYIPTKTGRFSSYSEDPWTEEKEREPLRDHTQVIVVGGGFGGLLQGARLFDQGIKDIRTIEIGGDFGGTWYWNRYPGAMCDIEAHIYLPLLEELNYAPKHRYSYGPEMLEISQRIGRDYGLYEKALFQTSVKDATWDEENARWVVRTDRGDEITADILIVACGRQSLPKLPGIPGIEDFEGHIFHSSRWDYDYTGGDASGGLLGLIDKKVGVIGTGATGLQVVPAVAEDAQELFVFQRTPSTVGVRGQQETPPDWVDMSQPGWQRERRANFQAHVQFGSRADVVVPELDLVADGWTSTFEVLAEPIDKIEARLGRTPDAEELNELSIINDYRVTNSLRSRIDEVVADPAVADALKPYYRWWCKRPGWHDDYLESFNRDNVHLVDTQGQGVEAFTKTGVIVGGKEFPLDCVIMATGFEATIEYTRLAGFEFHGRGTNLTDHWRKAGARTFHGMSTDKFPNLFFIGGNLQTTSSVNAVHLLDEQAQYVAHIVSNFVERGARTIEATTEAVDAWVQEIRTAPSNKSQFEFYLECTPGYYNNDGKAASMDDLFTGGRYGGGALAYYELLENWSDGSLEGFTTEN